MSKPRITIDPSDVSSWESVHGPLGNIRHGHQAADYEDKLEASPAKFPTELRLTCPRCRDFAPIEHTLGHIAIPSRSHIRAERNTQKNEVDRRNKGQFTLTYDE